MYREQEKGDEEQGEPGGSGDFKLGGQRYLHLKGDICTNVKCLKQMREQDFWIFEDDVFILYQHSPKCAERSKFAQC